MRLTIVVDVDDIIDPTLNDPHDIAESIIETYTEMRDANPHYPWIEFVGAEWG
jgi:hypothetical protein